ncbi:MAG: RNase adapter RapZ [Nevskia sp.]
MRLVIVSGLSGAGKTVALKQYEDLGYYCIDNIPLDLVQPLIAHAIENPGPRYRQLALGVDARSDPREIERFPAVLDALRAQAIDIRVLFLSADDSVILRRYNETRRRHPLSSCEISLLDAIRLERKLLKPIADLADVPLDTSRMNLHELRSAIGAQLPEAGAGRLAVLFLSFGFKNGGPEGADFVFDARCLPNPHWVPELRALTGRDPEIAAYLEAHAAVGELLGDITRFLERWLPAFQSQDRAYVTVAIGCTGGQHRSVYLVEKLAQIFNGRYPQVVTKHRELDK